MSTGQARDSGRENVQTGMEVVAAQTEDSTVEAVERGDSSDEASCSDSKSWDPTKLSPVSLQTSNIQSSSSYAESYKNQCLTRHNPFR